MASYYLTAGISYWDIAGVLLVIFLVVVLLLLLTFVLSAVYHSGSDCLGLMRTRLQQWWMRVHTPARADTFATVTVGTLREMRQMIAEAGRAAVTTAADVGAAADAVGSVLEAVAPAVSQADPGVGGMLDRLGDGLQSASAFTTLLVAAAEGGDTAAV